MALDIVALEEWAKKMGESDYWTNMTNTTNVTSIGGWGEYEYVPYEWYYGMPTSDYWRIENLLKDTEVFEMYVYNIFLVNTEECKVVQQYENIIAESEKMAMLGIVVHPDLKELLEKGKLKVIFNQVGGFDRFKKSEE